MKYYHIGYLKVMPDGFEGPGLQNTHINRFVEYDDSLTIDDVATSHTIGFKEGEIKNFSIKEVSKEEYIKNANHKNSYWFVSFALQNLTNDSFYGVGNTYISLPGTMFLRKKANLLINNDLGKSLKATIICYQPISEEEFNANLFPEE